MLKTKKKSTWNQLQEGEWTKPCRKDYLLACCDCGLVHRINFRIDRGYLELQAFRDEKATKRRRKEMEKCSN